MVHLQALEHDTINTSLPLPIRLALQKILALINVSTVTVMLNSAGGLATSRLIRLNVHLVRCLIGSLNSAKISHAQLRHIETVRS